jgi:hypothetical protein
MFASTKQKNIPTFCSLQTITKTSLGGVLFRTKTSQTPNEDLQVRRNPNFDRCRVNFHKKIFPHNLVMWSSVANAPENGLLDVIYHHQ